jgi:SagB-type dehydrogenase family enzyme
MPVRKKHQLYAIIALLAILFISYAVFIKTKAKLSAAKKPDIPELVVTLPKVKSKNIMYLDEAIQKRRSVRNFSTKPLSKRQLSLLLWATQGITSSKKALRASPSAGALYPLTLYVIKDDGVWIYLPNNHALKLIFKGDSRSLVAKAALNQSFIEQAPVVIVISAILQKTIDKYGKRGTKYVYLEAGHAAQNLLLEAVSLGLGSISIGTFSSHSLQEALYLTNEETPLYVIPVGYEK